jgi:hypothetical protein
MAQRDPFLTEEEFRYAAECRRLARLARRKTPAAQRIDIAGYLRALQSLGQIWAGFADRPTHHSSLAARSARR